MAFICSRIRENSGALRGRGNRNLTISATFSRGRNFKTRKRGKLRRLLRLRFNARRFGQLHASREQPAEPVGYVLALGGAGGASSPRKVNVEAPAKISLRSPKMYVGSPSRMKLPEDIIPSNDWRIS